MSKPIIRFVKPHDLTQLIILCEKHAIFEQSIYNSNNKIELLNNALFKEVPDLYCLVIESENKLIGYTTFMTQYSTWDCEHYIYMDCLFMTKETRGLGFGEKLINRIKQEGKKLNCNLIQWQTPDFNKRAMKFYNRIGAKSKNKERYFLEI